MKTLLVRATRDMLVDIRDTSSVRILVESGLVAAGDRCEWQGESAEITSVGTLKWRSGEYASVVAWVNAVATDNEPGAKAVGPLKAWEIATVNGRRSSNGSSFAA